MRGSNADRERYHAAMKPIAACALALMLSTTGNVHAGEPWLPPGDMRVRHDIQFLVDEGVINLPTTAWPIAVSDLAAALDKVQKKPSPQPSPGKPGEGANPPEPSPQPSPASAGEGARRAGEGVSPPSPGLPGEGRGEGSLSPAQSMALARLRKLAAEGHPTLGLEARAAVHPTTLRTFADDPRAGGELTGYAAGFFGGRFGGRLEVTAVANPAVTRVPTGDETTVRLDGSYLAGKFGNWIVTAGAQDRWWGPGWDGSLILSNNARPVPALSLDRAVSDPFETKWLSWIGPWRLTTFMGYMEGGRNDYDHPLLWGMRVSARPAKGLEIGLERTAQWCGEGRPCGWNDFWNLLTGHDNAGMNVSAADEPGNQLASWVIRWASPIGSWPYAPYWQHTGETVDTSHIPRPYRTFDLVGLETWGESMVSGSSWRAGLEWAHTRCGAVTKDPTAWDCTYNHYIFTDGYRYYGRPLGDSMDGDGETYGLRYVRVDAGASVLTGLLRYTMVNRGGAVPDPHHSIAPGLEDWWSVDATYRRPLGSGWIEASAGGDYRDRKWNDRTAMIPRVSLTWHHEFQ